MEKLDLKKTMKHLYLSSAKDVVQVDVPPMNYLTIDGKGDPNTSPDYADAVADLFSAAHFLKFMVKKGAPASDFAASNTRST